MKNVKGFLFTLWLANISGGKKQEKEIAKEIEEQKRQVKAF